MFPLLLLLACGEAEVDWRPAIDGWTAGAPLPDVPLVDQDGAGFTLGDTRGHWLALGFIYTRCPRAEACPMTMSKLVALDAAAQDGEVDLQLLAVTLDPAHDTPERLTAFGARHGVDHERFRLATGDPELVSQALPSLFNVVALPGPRDTLDHTVRIALVDPEGRTVGKWSDEDIVVDTVLARIAPPKTCDAGTLIAAPHIPGYFEGRTVALCDHGESTWGFVTDRPGEGGPVGDDAYTLYRTTPLTYRPGVHEDGEVVRGIASWSPGQLEAELSDGAWERHL